MESPHPTCLICMDSLGPPKNGISGKRRQKVVYKPKDCWRLRCGHAYCVGCLLQWIETRLQEHKVPIFCAAPNCKREVRPVHLASVLPPAAFEKFSKLVTLKAIEAESVYCPNKTCSQVFVKPSRCKEKHECLFCKTKFCVKCQVEWHEGLTCNQYKRMAAADPDSNDAKLHRLKNKHKWKQCPSCHAIVERRSGCNTIYCLCGRNFCYKCGETFDNGGCNCTKAAYAQVQAVVAPVVNAPHPVLLIQQNEVRGRRPRQPLVPTASTAHTTTSTLPRKRVRAAPTVEANPALPALKRRKLEPEEKPLRRSTRKRTPRQLGLDK
ncbi:hypothetical protein LEN26_003027 [Aphanomyces euteiches]|nr:hypothetical protein LEN26_003027 [Aphanomyces euteiches]